MHRKSLLGLDLDLRNRNQLIVVINSGIFKQKRYYYYIKVKGVIVAPGIYISTFWCEWQSLCFVNFAVAIVNYFLIFV